ncbi:uncharacterized protein LOC106161620 [Lingula anatina]|uniref:Uncharacterized protein LOC106161620 n=1 Tax=Lingula anatina TaxID=7574 RepID=A0A1S3I771_LINAN|nr:uncharacterized protein LOC106161620 [Lingula anatina]|eukprot:XP_013394097.1 uncharacterized protein LOC106161620 [Lingula anatina]
MKTEVLIGMFALMMVAPSVHCYTSGQATQFYSMDLEKVAGSGDFVSRADNLRIECYNIFHAYEGCSALVFRGSGSRNIYWYADDDGLSRKSTASDGTTYVVWKNTRGQNVRKSVSEVKSIARTVIQKSYGDARARVYYIKGELASSLSVRTAGVYCASSSIPAAARWYGAQDYYVQRVYSGGYYCDFWLYAW